MYIFQVQMLSPQTLHMLVWREAKGSYVNTAFLLPQ